MWPGSGSQRRFKLDSVALHAEGIVFLRGEKQVPDDAQSGPLPKIFKYPAQKPVGVHAVHVVGCHGLSF